MWLLITLTVTKFLKVIDLENLVHTREIQQKSKEKKYAFFF